MFYENPAASKEKIDALVYKNMYNTMRHEMQIKTGKKENKKGVNEKEEKYMSEDEIIKRIEHNSTMGSSSHSNNSGNNKWIKNEYSHPGIYVNKYLKLD